MTPFRKLWAVRLLDGTGLFDYRGRDVRAGPPALQSHHSPTPEGEEPRSVKEADSPQFPERRHPRRPQGAAFTEFRSGPAPGRTLRPRPGRYNAVVDRASQQACVAQWRRAAVALAEQRRRELRALSDEDALAASDALLAFAALLPLDAGRLVDSGLVRQQALFHRRHR